MDLNHMLSPSKSPEKCNLQLLDQPPDRLVCLFEQKTVKGWWPCTCEQNGKKAIAVRTQGQLIQYTELIHTNFEEELDNVK